MKYIDYDIQEELEALEKAVADRTAAGMAQPPGSELDEIVCMRSRALYLRYTDTALWRGSIDSDTDHAVFNALEKAVNCLPDSEVKISVSRRFEDFKGFSARLTKQVVGSPHVAALRTNAY